MSQSENITKLFYSSDMNKAPNNKNSPVAMEVILDYYKLSQYNCCVYMYSLPLQSTSCDRQQSSGVYLLYCLKRK